MSEQEAGNGRAPAEAGSTTDGGAAGEVAESTAAPSAEQGAGAAAQLDEGHPQQLEPEAIETQHPPVEVGLQRSVRVGRLIVAGIVAGAVVGIVLALLFPVQEGADYELGQAVGVAAVFGGAIGLGAGALLALLLGIVARRNRGEALAVQTDVR